MHRKANKEKRLPRITRIMQMTRIKPLLSFINHSCYSSICVIRGESLCYQGGE